ncbi:MAG: integrase arm-type DNA-binding domain-containing protein [Rhodospirillaceae bacterium]|nr:integrase arm-type DNA-binding domain-containing protein [Rhodospirillaceae bacterium]
MPLTDIQIKSVKPLQKPYKLTDGEGMFLYIHPSGSKYWRLKYRFGNKEKLLALGIYPEISLFMARQKRAEAKELLISGIDPSTYKKEQKLISSLKLGNTFEEIAYDWHSKQKDRWTERYGIHTWKRLKADLFSELGNKSIKDLTALQLLSVLRKVEARGAIEIAHRLLQTTGQIFRYAVAIGKAERDISHDLRGALKTRKKISFKSLKENELPEFLTKLNHYDGELQTKLALMMALLTFVRTTELRGARWEEIDFDKAEWRLPATRMKMRELHIVPLSTQTLFVLKEIQAISGNREFLFPNRNNPQTFISENTLLYALYRMGYHSRATVHG